MFGGLNVDMGKEGKIRGEINVLLVGDPGAAKSQVRSAAAIHRHAYAYGGFAVIRTLS